MIFVFLKSLPLQADMKKILCLSGHGFLEGIDMSELLKREFSQCEIIVPELFKRHQWLYPQDAIPYISDLCDQLCPDLIIGIGLGGCYTIKMHNYRRICINPSTFYTPMVFENSVALEELDNHLFDSLSENSRRLLRCYLIHDDTHFFPLQMLVQHLKNSVIDIPRCGHNDEAIFENVIKRVVRQLISPVWDMLDKYDEIKIYEGGSLDYYLAKKNGKFGILDTNGNEVAPVIMDEVYEMIDTDGCIPLVKDGKWGLVYFYNYVAPIYDRMVIRSEEYVDVWLNGVQGWLDMNGQFTTDESRAYIGSWYDVDI